MLTKEQAVAVTPTCKIILIIFAALAMGPLTFAAIAVFIRFSSDPAFVGDLGILPKIGLGMAFIGALLSLVVPSIFMKQSVSGTAKKFSGEEINGPEAAKGIAEGIQTFTIIRMALLEGVIFVNLMFLLLTGSIVNLIAAGVLWMIMFLGIPLPHRVINKIESKLEDAKFLQKTS